MTAGWRRGHVVVALALVAVTPLGAGCLDTASAAWDDVRASTGFPPEEVSAKSARDEADAAARAWHADARLAGVHAVEWRPHDTESGRGFNESAFPSDPDVGNGRATAWRFEYVTATERFSVTVRADGSLRDEDRFAADHSQAYAAAGESPGWQVDSDDAIAKLEERSTWRDGARNAQMVINSLTRNGTHSTWSFIAFDAQWQGVVGFVDPATGDVEGVYAWNRSGWDGGDWSWNGSSGDWGAGSWSGGGEPRFEYEEAFTGTLTRFEPEARHEFPVTAGGRQVRVDASFSPANAASVRLAVLDPEGQEIPFDCPQGVWGNGGKGSCSGWTSVAGPHTLVIALTESGAYVEYDAVLTVRGGGSAWGSPSAGACC